MRAPANKRGKDEIITEIIKRVKCPPTVAPFVQQIVQRLIHDLHTTPESFSGNQKENVEFAERFRNQIIELEHTLKSASNNPFVLSVLFEERFWQLWWTEQNTPIAINAKTKRYIAQERLHQNYFTELLGRLRAQSDKIISGEPGEHGGTKHRQRGAAWASFVVLDDVARHTETKLRLSCAPTSTFVEVARLFHEAATGEYGANLITACKEIKRVLQRHLDAKI